MKPGTVHSGPRFKPGQSVALSTFSRGTRAPAAIFEIVRVMPVEGRGTEYRIRDRATGGERIAAEGELGLAASTQAGAALDASDRLFGPQP